MILLHQCLRSLPTGGTRHPAAASVTLCNKRHLAHADRDDLAIEPQPGTEAHAAAHCADGGSLLAPSPKLCCRTPLPASSLTHVRTPVCVSGTGHQQPPLHGGFCCAVLLSSPGKPTSNFRSPTRNVAEKAELLLALALILWTITRSSPPTPPTPVPVLPPSPPASWSASEMAGHAFCPSKSAACVLKFSSRAPKMVGNQSAACISRDTFRSGTGAGTRVASRTPCSRNIEGASAPCTTKAVPLIPPSHVDHLWWQRRRGKGRGRCTRCVVGVRFGARPEIGRSSCDTYLASPERPIVSTSVQIGPVAVQRKTARNARLVSKTSRWGEGGG